MHKSILLRLSYRDDIVTLNHMITIGVGASHQEIRSRDMFPLMHYIGGGITFLSQVNNRLSALDH